jgi:hypothetical protein
MELTTLLDIAFGLAIGWVWGRYFVRRRLVKSMGKLVSELWVDVIAVHDFQIVRLRPDLAARNDEHIKWGIAAGISPDELVRAGLSVSGVAPADATIAINWLQGQDVSQMSGPQAELMRSMTSKPPPSSTS